MRAEVANNGKRNERCVLRVPIPSALKFARNDSFREGFQAVT